MQCFWKIHEKILFLYWKFNFYGEWEAQTENKCQQSIQYHQNKLYVDTLHD